MFTLFRRALDAEMKDVTSHGLPVKKDEKEAITEEDPRAV